jgi:hypothetical protein
VQYIQNRREEGQKLNQVRAAARSPAVQPAGSRQQAAGSRQAAGRQAAGTHAEGGTALTLPATVGLVISIRFV